MPSPQEPPTAPAVVDPPAAPVPPVRPDPDDEEPPPGFFARYRVVLGLVAGLALVGAVVLVIRNVSSDKTPPKRAETLQLVKLLPTPPPPPPPPKVTPPPEQPKMTQQPKMVQPEPKPLQPAPKNEPPKAANKPPGAVGGLTAKAGTDNGFGLRVGNGGGGLGTGTGNGGGGGSQWGWYASEVQARVALALRSNPHTRNAAARVQVRIWADQTGRINRAQLVGSTGDPALDRAITDEVLQGLQLQAPPPAGMPMPITMRVTAVRAG